MEENNKNNVLIVDDDLGVCTSLREILKGRFSVFTADSAKTALEVIHKNSNGSICNIDLVLSDICMSEMDGLGLLKEIKKRNPRVEVIMMTGYSNPENTLSALKLGASDYLVKPFQTQDVLEAVEKVMFKRKEFVRGEKAIADLRMAIQRNYSATTEALMMTIDAKDNYTKEHCARVAGYMVEFARQLGLGEEKTELLRKISMLHDIGKIGIKEHILNKPGILLPEEFEEIKHHPSVGFQIVQPCEFLGEGRDVVLYHQERFDGKGYPAGLKGEEIPLGARMMAITDSFDAMTTDRPYRKKLDIKVALSELKKHSGTQFDPELVNIFLEITKKSLDNG